MATEVDIKKQPPNSQEAEEALLGAVLLNNKVLIDIVKVVSPDDFYRTQNRLIYEHMTKMWERGDPIDLVTLKSELESAKNLHRMGGSLYIDQLFDRVPSSQNAAKYAGIVHEKALLRKVAKLGNDLLNLSHESSESSDNILDQVGRKFIELASQEYAKKSRTMPNIMQELIPNLEERKVYKGFSGLQTGFSDLDNLLGGFQKSDFIILAARPSVGKTAFALNISQNIAREGKKVLFFSIEMSAEQLALRILSTVSGVSSDKIRKGNISNKDWDQKISPAIDEMFKMDIIINDSAGMTPLGIRADARQIALDPSGSIDLIVVDYIQLISTGRRYDSRVQEVSDISRALKSLARELGVPVLALSQLSRESEKQSRPPRLSDLRESGALEQDADVVMFLHRDDPKEELNIDGLIDVKLHVDKHRNGPTGKINLKFEKNRTWFKEETKIKEPEFDDEPHSRYSDDLDHVM